MCILPFNVDGVDLSAKPIVSTFSVIWERIFKGVLKAEGAVSLIKMIDLFAHK